MIGAWPSVKLGEALQQVQREEKVDPSREYRLLGAHWYGEGLYIKDVKSGQEIRSDRLYRVKAGDFVYNRLFAWKGSFAFVGHDLNGCYVSGEFPCFEINHERLDGKFLWWYFRQEHTWTESLGLSVGATPTSRNRLKEAFFLKMRVPLPALDEQRRIVARIEGLAGKLAEARELRRQAREKTDALLANATRMAFGALKSGTRSPIEGIAEVRGGIQKSPSRIPVGNPVRYLTVAHVHRNRILLTEPRYFEVSPEELERWRLVPGDVLIIEGNGSAEQIGRTALFRGEIEHCVHQNHVIRIRPNRSQIEPAFLNAYLNSPLGQEEVQSRSRTTSGLRSLSVGRINKIEVPIPTLVEQHRIVAYLDGLQAQVGALKRLQAETAAELDALLPSILDRAFRGEL